MMSTNAADSRLEVETHLKRDHLAVLSHLMVLLKKCNRADSIKAGIRNSLERRRDLSPDGVVVQVRIGVHPHTGEPTGSSWVEP